MDYQKIKRMFRSCLAGFAVFKIFGLFMLVVATTLQVRSMLDHPRTFVKPAIETPDWVVAVIRMTGLHTWVFVFLLPVLLALAGKLAEALYVRKHALSGLVLPKSALLHLGLLIFVPAIMGGWIQSAVIFTLVMSGAKDPLPYCWPLGWLVSAGVFTFFSRDAIGTRLRKAAGSSIEGRKDPA